MSKFLSKLFIEKEKKANVVRFYERQLEKEMVLTTLGIKYLFYFTHKNNIKINLDKGLFTKEKYNELNYSFVNIEPRNRFQMKYYKTDPIFDKPFNNYLELYFNPKNHILKKREAIQDNAVLYLLDRSITYKEGDLFSSGDVLNKKSVISKDFNDITHFDWKCILDKNLSNIEPCKNHRSSSLLIENHIPKNYIRKVFTFHEDTYQEIIRHPESKYFYVYKFKKIF